MFSISNIKKRLTSLGYTPTGSDEVILTFTITKVIESIKADINRREVPRELEPIAIDMVVGEFLLYKKTFTPGELTQFDLSCAIKQLQIGDTNTTFAVDSGSSTDEQLLNTFISYLLSYGKSEFSAYRCIKW